MRSRMNQLVAVLAIAVVTMALFAGSALADAETATDGPQADPGSGQMFGGMMGGMDQETWGEMIQHMNEIHGPEQTAQMLQWMNQEDGHCTDGEGYGEMMGSGFGGMLQHGFSGIMGWGFNGFNGMGSMMGGVAGQ